MRLDAPETIAEDAPCQESESLPVRREQTFWGRRLTMVGLALLIVATSLAAGFWVSWWAVPPYLALVGWLLLAPAGAEPESADESPSEAVAVAEEPTVADESPETVEDTPPVAGPPAKPKRARRAKPKGAAPPAPAPVEVTWVKVGPGKFVRVENPAPAGPPPEAEPELVPNPEPEPDANPREPTDPEERPIEAVSAEAEDSAIPEPDANPREPTPEPELPSALGPLPPIEDDDDDPGPDGTSGEPGDEGPADEATIYAGEVDDGVAGSAPDAPESASPLVVSEAALFAPGRAACRSLRRERSSDRRRIARSSVVRRGLCPARGPAASRPTRRRGRPRSPQLLRGHGPRAPPRAANCS